MKCNVSTLRAARSGKAMTQEKLAALARVDVRTIQRAEAGRPINHDTLADIAAVLGLPPNALLQAPTAAAAVNDEPVQIGSVFDEGVILRRATSGKAVVQELEWSQLAKIECEAEPTPENLDTLREALQTFEGLIGDPWQGDRGLKLASQIDRLEAIVAVNGHLQSLAAMGLALYTGSSLEAAVMPSYSDEGYTVGRGQPWERIIARRLVIVEHRGERVTVQRATAWPVEVRNTDIGEDDDDDPPF